MTLCAFDLLELDGEDLRRAPIGERKLAFAKLLRQSHPGIALVASGRPRRTAPRPRAPELLGDP